MPAMTSLRDQEGRTGEVCPYPCACSCRPRFRLGEGDHAGAHPTQYFRRWPNRPWRDSTRPRAKLRLVLVSDPSGLVAALACDEGEHRVPVLAGLGIVSIRLRASVGDESKFAISNEHITRRPL